MTHKTIMILGGGTMQVPAINLAKGMGLTVIVADGNPDVPGRKIADFFENVDLKDHRGMIETALKYKHKGSLDGVFTAGTDFSETVARVAAAAGLPGIPVASAVNASNKGVMRKVLHDAGIAVPRNLLLNSPVTMDNCEGSVLSGGLDFPLVVKPVDNMGSRGIRRVDSCPELKEAVISAVKYSGSGGVIIEEYLEGPEYSLDALIYDGEIHICGVADRHIFFPPYFVEMGHTIPAAADPFILEEVTEVFKQGIKALGITNGAAKGDIKWSRGRAYVGEIAARLSGGYMSGWTYPYSSGVEVTRSAIRIALGLPPEDLTPTGDRTSAERAVISIPGIVTEISGKEDAFTLEGVKHLFIRIQKGSRVSFPTNNVEKCGNCIAVSGKRGDAVFMAEEGCRRIFIRLKPGEELTEDFLFNNSEPWVPAAFTLEKSENISFLESLPPGKGSRGAVWIPVLPDMEGEEKLEWHGKDLRRAFNEVVTITGCRTFSGENIREGILPGKIFYSAFLRGGVQGGVWVIDTVRSFVENGGRAEELFKKWEN